MRREAQTVRVGDRFADSTLVPHPMLVVLVHPRRPTAPVRFLIANGEAFEYAPTELIDIGD